MAVPVLGRPVESKLISDFLAAATAQPAAMVIEGEAGIGKTTLWVAATDSATEAGFQVLSARPAQAESALAYGALADMLGDVDGTAWDSVPAAQRSALDRMLLRGSAEEGPADPRAVAAGFLSLIKNLEQAGPVLLAIDDLQWLDSSSLRIIGFAARRLSGRAGVLGTVRTDPRNEPSTAWFELPRLATVRRMRLAPLTLGGLRAVISEQIGNSLPRAAMVRIYEVSQGNPFYALELARAMDDDHPGITERLPGSLAELVRARIGNLGADVRTVLLAASCLTAPTVELVERATGHDAQSVVRMLGDAENNGILTITGHKIRFTHPLLARGVYSEATATERREIHRKLAEIIDETEQRARHLAMAVSWADSHALECLDTAAQSAAMRGAPAAAAELLELAVGLGGDTAERRIMLAGCHFNAGDIVSARVVLEETIAALGPGSLRAQALALLGPVRIFGDSFLEGVAAFERSTAEASDNLPLRVQALVAVLLPLFITGQLAAAAHRADGAVVDSERLGDALLLSQALSLRVFLHFLRGDGLDDASLRAALELEDRNLATAGSGFELIVRPRTTHAILLGWTGQLETAHEEMRSLRQSYVEQGLEFHLIYVMYYSVQVEIWRGNFTEATGLAEYGMEIALAAGSEVGMGAALTWRSALAAYAGHAAQVRRDVPAAVAAMKRCGAHMFEGWPIAIAGFLDVSLGDYDAALDTLDPLLSNLDLEATEIYLAEFVPDAVEALVYLGRLDEAEPLVDALERNGHRLDRAWMLAVGGRSRSLIQGARGDLGAAARSAEEAMRQHARIPMPFEKARTQLVLGQLERRRRHRDAATTALQGALETFERLRTPLWAERARTELARTDVATTKGSTGLTEGERRVAELVAKGMTNRDVAAALFISSKTVEANLVRIYRKLGIHSRAELGRLFGESTE